MKLTWNYQNAVAVLPAAVADCVKNATKKDLCILLALAAEPLCAVDLTAAARAVATRLSMQENEVENALAFWRGTGVLVLDEGDDAPQAPAAVAQKAERPARIVADRGVPSYSTEELTALLTRRRELTALIDDCQRTFGKIFNTAEVGIIAGLVDYLGLDGEYILLLLAHCVHMEKKSLRYMEKMALTLHDEGVTAIDELQERLRRIETMAATTGKIRALFGIASRALTTKEKGMIEKWVCTMCYGDDVLKKAYEITVDSIGKASIPYANTILERWHAEGYRTLEDVERAIAEYKRKKTANGSSFDVDDFFEAALKRTYGE